ncbi:MAG: hypothetical protein GXX80_05470 [Thermotogaceae bacterium]|nr:hypothetical protein [Thermotogaceae bacterium]
MSCSPFTEENQLLVTELGSDLHALRRTGSWFWTKDQGRLFSREVVLASECFPLKAVSLMILVYSEDGEPLTVDLRRLPAKQPHFPG